MTTAGDARRQIGAAFVAEAFAGIMQHARSHSFFGSWRWLAAIVAATVVAPASALAQQVGGALGVVLDVLPAPESQAVELFAFSMDRDGIGRLDMAAPANGSGSLHVMATVASSEVGADSVARAPLPIRATREEELTECPPASKSGCTSRLSYRVNLAGSVGSKQREATVRISVLVVPAGT